MATFLFWVAFTHESKSVGVCIVEADDYADPATVVQKTLDLGMNPGRGEIQVHRVRREEDVPASHRNRFLTPTEVAAFIEGKAN
jgi:hypothetical protein